MVELTPPVPEIVTV
jgi:hypothetical protein